ncbi:MAG: hypothetical protein ACHQUC_08145 [Chlamydiales bacterium]
MISLSAMVALKGWDQNSEKCGQIITALYGKGDRLTTRDLDLITNEDAKQFFESNNFTSRKPHGQG